jgi:hypothetical protein
MNNAKDYSAIGRRRHYKNLLVKATAIVAAAYIPAGMIIDAIPFPGTGFFHGNLVENSTIKGYTPTGNNSFKSLELKRDISGVSDEEARTAREIAGSDKIIDKTEVKAVCSQLAGENDKIDSFNLMLQNVKNKRIADVRVSSWNLNGCSQKVGQ